MRNEQAFAGWFSPDFTDRAKFGQPIVFLHGVTRCWKTYAPLIPILGAVQQIRVLDFRGHGDSPRSAGQYRVIDYVSDALDFVKSQSNGPTVIYGHSLGAMVAAAVAAELPESVEAVILEDPPFETMGSKIRESFLYSYFCGLRRFAGSKRPVAEIARELAEMRFGPPGLENSVRLGDERDGTSLRFSAKCLKQLDPEVLEPIVEGCWLERYERDSILRRIQCPTLLLQGDVRFGGMLTDEDANQVEKLIRDCTRVRLNGVGHLIHWVETGTVLRLVMGFLGSLDDDRKSREP